MVKSQEFQYTGKTIEYDKQARKFYSLWMDCINRGEKMVQKQDLKIAEKYGEQAKVWFQLFWYRVLEVTDMFDCRQRIIITKDWKIGITNQKDPENLDNVLESIVSLPQVAPLSGRN